MSLHLVAVLGFLIITFTLALMKDPFWGLLAYVFLYFNIPHPFFNWWAGGMPDLRWSFLAAGVLVLAMFLHSTKLNPFKWSYLPNLKYLLLLLALMVVISPAAISPSTSFEKLYEFFRYIVSFLFFALCVTNPRKYRYLVWLYLLCCFNLSWEAYLHPEFRIAGRLEFVRTPDSTDSNQMATLLMTSLPFLVVILLRGSLFEKASAFAMSVFIINGIVLCGSRGAFLAMIIMMISFVILSPSRQFRMKMIIAGMGLSAMFAVLLDPTYIERLVTLQETGETGAGRTVIWQYGLEMAKDHPLGTGGLGFELLSPVYIPSDLLTKGRRAPHNTYLLILVEQNAAGLLLFVLFFCSTFGILHGLRRERQTDSVQLSSEHLQLTLDSLAVQVAVIGVLAAGVFVDRLYFEPLYWLSALPCAMRNFPEMRSLECEVS